MLFQVSVGAPFLKYRISLDPSSERNHNLSLCNIRVTMDFLCPFLGEKEAYYEKRSIKGTNF